MRLVIAEKPSVAMSLAKVLGAGARRDGYMEGSGWLKEPGGIDAYQTIRLRAAQRRRIEVVIAGAVRKAIGQRRRL